MTSRFNMKYVALSLMVAGMCSPAWGAKLVEVRSVDDEYLMVHWHDGEVEYKDDGKGPTAFMGHETGGGDLLKTLRARPRHSPPPPTPPATRSRSNG